MPLKINSQTVAAFADERLGHNAAVQRDLRALASFFGQITGPEVRTASAEEHKRSIQEIITNALSASRRLIDPSICSALDVSTFLALDRFMILHFASVQCAFLAVVERLILSMTVVDGAHDAHLKSAGRPRSGRPDFQQPLDHIHTLDIPYTMAVDPASQLDPFFYESFDILLGIIGSGSFVWRVDQPIVHFVKMAHQEYAAWLSGDGPAAKDVRSFLNYEQQIERQNQVLDDVAGLSGALIDWIQSGKGAERRKDRWALYRQYLAGLPDEKATMFDEDFGVRKVFVQPTAGYRVAGMRREKPAEVADVAGLIGTLISDRTQSEDLILLCGGPGSGKSTLCRVLASEMAANPNIYPVFLRLRRLNESQEIASFIETHLQQEGLIDKLSDVADIPRSC